MPLSHFWGPLLIIRVCFRHIKRMLRRGESTRYIIRIIIPEHLRWHRGIPKFPAN